MTSSNRSRLALVGAAAILVVALIFMLTIANGPRTDGPLQPPDRTGVEFPLPAGQLATWGMTLPINPTMQDIRLLAVEPQGLNGLDLLGIQINDPAVEGSIVNALGFLPEGMSAEPVEGSVLPALGSLDPERQILIGVELPAGSDHGVIESLVLRYEAGGVTYSVELPWELSILSAPS